MEMSEVETKIMIDGGDEWLMIYEIKYIQR